MVPTRIEIGLVTGEPPTPKSGDMPIRQVDWPEAIRFAAIQSQLYDFDLALNALGRIRRYSTPGPLDPMVHHALYATALIYYARAFKSGVRNSCSIDSLGLQEAERLEHDRLIALRDKWLAHSVNDLDQVAVGILLSTFEKDATVVDVARMRFRGWSVPLENVQAMEDFIRGVRKKVEVRNQEAYEELLARARNTPIAELQNRPELSLIAPGDDLETAARRRPTGV